MADDEFDLDDTGSGDSTEASLDDFFQPADSSGGEGGAPTVDDFFAPPKDEAGGHDGDGHLPMDPDKPHDGDDMFGFSGADKGASGGGDQPPPGLDDFSGPEDDAQPIGGEESDKSFFARNWLIIVIILLVLVLGGSGGYLAWFLVFQPKTTEVVDAGVKEEKPGDSKPKAKPKVKKKDAGGEMKGGENKPPETAPVQGSSDQQAPGSGAAPAKSGGKEAAGSGTKEDKKKGGGDKTKTGSKPPASEVKTPAGSGSKPAATVAKAETPAKEPAKKVHTPVVSTGGPYSVQVGSYMMAASKAQPEKSLRELGYSEFHYVPESRRMKIYHVLAGENLARDQAQKIKTELEGMGYTPELLPEGGGYKVRVYSYGSMSVANTTRNKLKKAGVADVEVKPETRMLTLDQLRVGRFASRSDAQKALRDLTYNGFQGSIIVKE